MPRVRRPLPPVPRSLMLPARTARRRSTPRPSPWGWRLTANSSRPRSRSLLATTCWRLTALLRLTPSCPILLRRTTGSCRMRLSARILANLDIFWVSLVVSRRTQPFTCKCRPAYSKLLWNCGCITGRCRSFAWLLTSVIKSGETESTEPPGTSSVLPLRRLSKLTSAALLRLGLGLGLGLGLEFGLGLGLEIGLSWLCFDLLDLQSAVTPESLSGRLRDTVQCVLPVPEVPVLWTPFMPPCATRCR